MKHKAEEAESRNIRLPNKVWGKLLVLALRDGRSIGNYVRWVLTNHVENRNGK